MSTGSGGVLGIVAAIGAGLLLFFMGEDEASASELPGGGGSGGNKAGGGGVYISPDDVLGKQEATMLGELLGTAAAACNAPGDCDTAKLRKIAKQIEAYPWTHPAVKQSAMGEAVGLWDMADAIDKAVGDENALLGSMLVAPCNEPTFACVEKMYKAADDLRAQPWQSPGVAAGAKEHAAWYEAKAKALEDSMGGAEALGEQAAAYYQDKWEE